jgi:YesN/AraC family two-component response regulator
MMEKILIVDDEKDTRDFMARALSGQYEVVTAADAELAMRQLESDASIRLMLSDIRMPGEDGLTMLAGLRSEFPDMQVSVLTGYRDFSYAQEAIRLGVTRFLLKPSKLDEIKEALSAMTDRLHASSSSDGGESGDSQQAGHYLVRRAIAYMEQHYAEKLTLFEVADACYVSQWHLSKLLNRYAGKSFNDILNTLRIEQAKRLLADPSLKIGDIGEMVGYADPAHFAKLFKKNTGMSANEFRSHL